MKGICGKGGGEGNKAGGGIGREVKGDFSAGFFICCASTCLCNWLFDENFSAHFLQSNEGGGRLRRR